MKVDPGVLRRAGLALAALLSWAPWAGAAQLVVGSGSSLSLGSASVDLGCADLVVNGGVEVGAGAVLQAGDVNIAAAGTLQGNSGALDVTGSWDNAGTFDAGTGSVHFVDGCGSASATILGSTLFFDLWMSTTTGKVYAFEAGSTQTVTQSLELMGAAGDRLTLRSTIGGSEAFIDLQGSQTTSHLDVKDNHASGNPISLGPGSVSSGNATGWILAAIPTLGWLGTAALCLTIATVAFRRLRSAA